MMMHPHPFFPLSELMPVQGLLKKRKKNHKMIMYPQCHSTAQQQLKKNNILHLFFTF